MKRETGTFTQMNAIKSAVIATISIFIFVGSAFAADDDITLGFDGLAEFSLDVGSFGVSFTGAAVLTCGSQLNCGAFPPSSGSNVIFDNFGSNGIIEAAFDQATTGRVTRVSARITGNRTITMTAFNDTGAILDQASTSGPNFVGSGRAPNELVAVETTDPAQSIARIVFRDGGNTFTIDDFTFNSAPRRVAIDAGHGTIGGEFQRPIEPPANIVEDQLTLDMSAKVESALQALGGYTVLQIRTGDNAPYAPANCSVPCRIDVNKRRMWAEKQEADILLSLHTNGSDDRTANGVETFYSATTSVASNASILATQVQSRLQSDLSLRDRGVKSASFWVINSSLVVSALAEVAFHSNSELAAGQTITDQEQLASPLFRQQASSSMAAGIDAFFNEVSGN